VFIAVIVVVAIKYTDVEEKVAVVEISEDFVGD